MEESLTCISPIDGQAYLTRNFATLEQVDHVLLKAKAAQDIWCQFSIAERKSFCVQAINILLSQKQEIAKELAWMMGRPQRYGASEIDGVAERSHYMIAICEEALAPITVSPKQQYTRFIKREPLGTVFVIAPWNYPYLTAINTVIPALLSGNTVVLKHSPQTPLCAERLVAAFLAAGVPEGIFQFLHIDHPQTADVIKSDIVDYVAFTGSVYGGQQVEHAAAGFFKGVGLELGGKDPAYVRADANLTHAAESIVDGAFFNSGQSCCAIERAYVHVDIFDDFLVKAIELTKQLKLGRPDLEETTLGPMVSQNAATFARRQIAEAIAQGAVSYIDERLFANSQCNTAYLAPQILTQVDHTMDVMTKESFAPILCIMAVESDEQAINLMNDSVFGLTAAIYTNNVDIGIMLGEKLNTGTFFLNRCDYLDPALAWTGVKQSGRGCSLSQLGFNTLTRPKSFNIAHPK